MVAGLNMSVSHSITAPKLGDRCKNIFGSALTKYTQAFDALVKASGVEPVVLPPRSPNLNAYCERFVRSIKEEALERMVMLGERSLDQVIHTYLIHYHRERNHQGLDNRLIAPERAIGGQTGHVVRRERLRGLLSYYYREAA